MDEVENEWSRQGDMGQAERSDFGRESMQQDETMVQKLACVRFAEVNLQAYNAKKCLNPTALSWVRRCSRPGTFDDQSSGVLCGGGGRV